ncbi:hypothetical protein [Aneurinibacillus migulanus]|uniref:hypothetical protein n=1 Tax=Aneurinibacillus migulanus TaxID=47500 RepID=UPI001F170974|nr:hypothetical protein [Aneurinibacillus migulanus]
MLESDRKKAGREHCAAGERRASQQKNCGIQSKVALQQEQAEINDATPSTVPWFERRLASLIAAAMLQSRRQSG